MKISAKKIEQRLLPLVLAFVLAGGTGCASSDFNSSCVKGEMQKCSCDGKGAVYGLRVCMDGREFSECVCGSLSENASSAGSSGGRAGASGKAAGRSGAAGNGGSAVAGGAAGKTEDQKGAGGAAPAVGAGGTATNEPSQGQGGSPTAVDAGGGGVTVVTLANGGALATGNGGDATSGPAANGGTGGVETGAGGSQVAANGGTIATGSGGSPATTSGAGGTVVPSTSAWIDFKYVCTTAPTALPTPTGACPTIQTTFSADWSTSTPITIKDKKADVIVGTKPTPDSKGPVVFFWHGYGADGPTWDLQNGLTDAYNLGVLRNGGMVVGFYADQTQSGGSIILDWDNGHLAAMDELLACAIAQNIGVDPCRIHSSGFSMGGLMTTQLSYRRSKYLASVVVYSGGLYTQNSAPSYQDPANKFAAMIVHGGSSDNAGMDFQAASINYLNDLKADGHFAFICNHGGGHAIPPGIGVPAWQFMIDHPYRITPEPYQSALPASFPTYCSL